MLKWSVFLSLYTVTRMVMVCAKQSPLHDQTRRRAMEAIRNLQGDRCDVDTTSIFESSSALRDASRAFDAEYVAAVRACGDSHSCTIDEDRFQATPGFVKECESAGGAIYEYDLLVGCVIASRVDHVFVQIDYLNVDHCFAPQSCDRKAIADEAAQETNSDLELFEEVFNEGDVVTVCHVDYKVSDSQGNTVVSDRINGKGASSAGRVTSMTGLLFATMTVMFISLF